MNDNQSKKHILESVHDVRLGWDPRRVFLIISQDKYLMRREWVVLCEPSVNVPDIIDTSNQSKERLLI